MKKILVLMAVVCVLASTGGAAAALEENQLGLFYDQAATIDEVDIAANSQQYLYLVLINPVSDLGTVQGVGGVECSIVPAMGDYLLGISFPVSSVNIGSSLEEIQVGFSSALPVVSPEGTVLATLSVFTMGNNPEGYFLRPPSIPALPNKMAYLDMAEEFGLPVEAVPVSGSHDRPVFTFGDYTIEENRQWGNVKSLYR